jgi:hypothetical protein
LVDNFAGLSWIQDLLQQYLHMNPDTDPNPTLLIPVDNDAVIKDLL